MTVIDREQEVLGAAAAEVSGFDAARETIREQSKLLVTEETAFFREALVLQIAATQIAVPSGTNDSRLKATIGLASLQRQLMVHGWDGLMEGKYAAAIQPLRIIHELSDYLMAASISEDHAARLLRDQEWEWGIKSVHAVLEAEFVQRSEQAVYSEWAERRRDGRKDLHQFAHTGGAAMLVGLRFLGDAFGAPRGPYFDDRMLKLCAAYYALVAGDLVFAIGFALGDYLADGRPWSTRQRAFLERWGAYRERRSLELGIQDATA